MWNKLFKSKSKQSHKKSSKLSDVVKNLTCKRVPKDRDNVDTKTKLEFLVGGACRFFFLNKQIDLSTHVNYESNNY